VARHTGRNWALLGGNSLLPLGIFVLQIRNLRDEECMLLFPILKPGVHYESTPIFFFAKMVTAVNERNGKSEEE
jgi:hypothetical protein